ncbi:MULTISPECIES: glycosyltransferase family 2 protein [Hansschlegelia]|nr:glycosyltransferase family A protein [Hansschlegelia zhihuaiae]
MLTVIVIPCFNERDEIFLAAKSFGFGLGEETTPKDTHLVLVDNGSTDGTPASLRAIRGFSRKGAVVVTSEAERGYVPPRAKGVTVAARLTRSMGVSPERVLILQADADTRYEPGYVDAFRQAAESATGPALIEGLTHAPGRFLDGHPGFQRLADTVDAEMAPFLVDDSLDVIVDDKVSGYFLASYVAWGGHQRQYRADGKEIHAETSRLFLRGKRMGAAHVRAPLAQAMPSRRKILRNSIRHFATAGFPRDEAWWRKWSRDYQGPRDLAAFEGPDPGPPLDRAIATRKAHLLALMSALPLLVAGPQQVEIERRRARLHPLVDTFFLGLHAPPRADDVAAVFDLALGAIDGWDALL